jgi:hypothetical protein
MTYIKSQFYHTTTNTIEYHLNGNPMPIYLYISFTITIRDNLDIFNARQMSPVHTSRGTIIKVDTNTIIA